MIANYGWVPFPYFQHVMIALLILAYMNFTKVNAYLENKIYRPVLEKYGKSALNNIKILVALSPLMFMLYLDMMYSSFSMANIGVTRLIRNDTINTFLKLFGAYCIVQVAAQDVGLKTGSLQADLVKSSWFQFLMYAGIAFSITSNRSASIIAALMYFQLKFFASEGKTKDVCFE